MQLRIMHSIKMQLLAGSFTCITHISSFSLQVQDLFTQYIKYNKRWEHFRADVCLSAAAGEDESVIRWITCQGAWRGDVGWWKMRPANCSPTIWASVTEFIIFFSPEGRFALLVFISTLALCLCEVTVLTETKTWALSSEPLCLPLNYTSK